MRQAPQVQRHGIFKVPIIDRFFGVTANYLARVGRIDRGFITSVGQTAASKTDDRNAASSDEPTTQEQSVAA